MVAQLVRAVRPRACVLPAPARRVVHSAPSASSRETKVGSPPMVRRTSPARSLASTEWPSASISCHCCSRVGLGDARRFVNPLNRHLVFEFRVAGIEHAGDRRGAAGVRRAGQRNMALAGKQPGCWVESDPAGARQVHLSPRVQIGKIGGGSGRSLERLHIRLKLNQIAGNKTRGEPQMAHDLDQQPGRVAA